jgi:hypothetical protein
LALSLTQFLVPVLTVPLRVCVTWGLLALLAPLLLLRGILELDALRVFAFIAIKDRPHYLFSGGESSGDVEDLVGVDQQAPPKFAHKVPAGRALKEACTISNWAMLGSSVQRFENHRMKSWSDSLGF